MRFQRSYVEVTLLGECQLAGRVYWYSRADGTVDLSIKALPILDLDRLMYQAFERINSPLSVDWLESSRSILRECSYALSALRHSGKRAMPGAGTTAGRNPSSSAFCTQGSSALIANEGRLATSKSNGRCNRLREIGRIAGRQQTLSRGSHDQHLFSRTLVSPDPRDLGSSSQENASLLTISCLCS